MTLGAATELAGTLCVRFLSATGSASCDLSHNFGETVRQVSNTVGDEDTSVKQKRSGCIFCTASRTDPLLRSGIGHFTLSHPSGDHTVPVHSTTTREPVEACRGRKQFNPKTIVDVLDSHSTSLCLYYPCSRLTKYGLKRFTSAPAMQI